MLSCSSDRVQVVSSLLHVKATIFFLKNPLMLFGYIIINKIVLIATSQPPKLDFPKKFKNLTNFTGYCYLLDAAIFTV